MSLFSQSGARADIRTLLDDASAQTWTDSELNSFIDEAVAWVGTAAWRKTVETKISLASISASIETSKFFVDINLGASIAAIISVTLLDAADGNVVREIYPEIPGQPASGFRVNSSPNSSSIVSGSPASAILQVPASALKSYSPNGQLNIRWRRVDRALTRPGDGTTVLDSWYWAVIFRACHLAMNRLVVNRVNFERWLELRSTDSASPSEILAAAQSFREQAETYRQAYYSQERR
jgi:hypothetical protein